MGRIGFEKNKRVSKVYNSKRVTAVVGGKKCKFRSLLEYRWAQYLEMLKTSKNIIDWEYEPAPFYFEGVKTAPVMYRVDFRVIESEDSIVYQETKGHHDGKTNEKLRRMAKHHPDIVMELVLQNVSKNKGVNARRVAKKYTRRIINSYPILQSIKKVIRWEAPIVEDL